MIGTLARSGFVRVAAIGMAMTLGATEASAAIYDLDFSDDTGFSAKFRFDTLSPDFYSAPSLYAGQRNQAEVVNFYKPSSYQSFYQVPLNFSYDKEGSNFYYTGEQLYSGPENDPTLIPNSYTLTGFQGFGGSATTGHLTITSVAGPGSPSPEVGAGLLSALAAAAALYLTRMRGTKARLATA